jgi:hypothetical protein
MTTFAGQDVGKVRTGAIVREERKIVTVGQVDYPLTKGVYELLNNLAAHLFQHNWKFRT